MKKFYAFFAAALMSVSVFASKEVVPSDAVLADYYEPGQLVTCIYVPANMACNDIVFVGTYNVDETGAWITDVATLAKFEPVVGYDGWYVAAVDDETAEPDAEKGLQGKPVMLDANGAFNWQYQIGGATVIRGGVQVVDGYSGEIDLIKYGTDAPNVYTVDAWKNNPCTAVYHNYTIIVISDGCNGAAVPYIAGSMNGWSFAPFQLDVAKTTEYGVPTYYYTFKGAEGADEFQLASALIDEEGQIVDEAGWKDDAYMQELTETGWARINGGSNYKAGEEAEMVFDLREANLQWARCDETPAEQVVVNVKFPVENRPETVEIIGGFDGWAGTAMAFDEATGIHSATVEAKANQFFKFRCAGSWDQELELYNDADDTWAKIADNQLVFGQLWENGVITLDFRETGRWTEPQGIENIVLTEKAQKVMVDGVMYIIRDNKMFNVQGTQVR